MPSGNFGDPALIEFIRDRIRRQGPVTFRWFMEQALYHPLHGYYAAGKASIGHRGDFLTSVSIGPLFGRLLARQFRQMWERMGKPAAFQIIEQGANNGDFARDVLVAAQSMDGEFFSSIRYKIVEPVESLRGKQQETLKEFGCAGWHINLEDLPPFEGVHFSNELLDAMPVHLLVFKNGAWRERLVDWSGGGFIFADGPLSSEKLGLHLKKLPGSFPENYTAEVNLESLDWLASLTSRLTSGYILIADYGYPRPVLYDPGRMEGTLACYSEHTRSPDPLENVGESDITAHVDFTSVVEQALALGLRVGGFTDQHHLMVALGRAEFPDSDAPFDPQRTKALREFKTLMHPNFMGLAFKFLALEKNLPPGPPLTGFEFASDPAKALALI